MLVGVNIKEEDKPKLEYLKNKWSLKVNSKTLLVCLRKIYEMEKPSALII